MSGYETQSILTFGDVVRLDNFSHTKLKILNLQYNFSYFGKFVPFDNNGTCKIIYIIYLKYILKIHVILLN